MASDLHDVIAQAMSISVGMLGDDNMDISSAAMRAISHSQAKMINDIVQEAYGYYQPKPRGIGGISDYLAVEGIKNGT
jgi:hypothetical protein